MFKVNSLKKVSDYANFLGVDYDGEDFVVEGISFDTRKSKRNQLFIPLIGENFDGNNFLPVSYTHLTLPTTHDV